MTARVTFGKPVRARRSGCSVVTPAPASLTRDPRSQTITSYRPLAAAQRASWLLDRACPGATAWSVARVLSLPGTDSGEVASAVVTVADARPALAIACTVVGSQPVTVPAAPLQLRRMAARAHPGLLAELADVPFDLATGPLLRAVVFDGSLLLVGSSLVVDSDSLGLLMADVQRVLAGGSPQLLITRPVDTAAPVIDLTNVRPASVSHSGRRRVRLLSEGQLAAADACADRLGTARADVFLAAYAWLLRDHAPLGEVSVERVNRRANAGNAVGPFSPISTVRLPCAGSWSLLSLICEVGAARSATVAAPAAALHAMFEDGDDGLPGQPVLCGRRSARSDLALVTLPNGVCWEHGPALSETAVAQLADDFDAFLTVALAQPDALLPAFATPATV